MNRILFLAAIGVTTAVIARVPTEPPKVVSPRGDALELLLLVGEKPTRLELRVEIDGKSVPAVWDETFAQLLAFHDRDGDGSLDKIEAARLPAPFALRQVLWGQFAVPGGDAPAWGELDLNGDGKVDGTELADFYRRAGLGGVLVGAGKAPATERLTEALLKHLDTNKDGTVDGAEWKAAPETLRKLDANDDELIGPGELMEKTAYPGALGSILVTAPRPGSKSDAVADALPFLVLPLRASDTHWAATSAARREELKLPAIGADDLLALRKSPAKPTWNARFGTRKPGTGVLDAVGTKPPVNERLLLARDGLRLELRADEGKLAGQVAAGRKRLLAQFAECDTNADGALADAELTSAKGAPFKPLLPAADRDADGKLSEKEFRSWLDLQEQVARGHVFLTVLDHGAGLFEVLDADHDGALSVRELRTARERLKAAGCASEGTFDRTKLPRQLLAAISHGHPHTALGKPLRTGPEWFKAMDRNGDGDVSSREFTGPASVFDKLDADKDGLLDADEAARVAAGK